MDLNKFRNQAILETLPNKSFNKVFGIGYNKTGSTSLEFIFTALGFRTPNQQEQELRVVKQLNLGNFRPLIDLVNQYDAFQDQPFSQNECYAQVDALFPDSKFILTVRDPEDWFNSLCRFHTKIWGVNNTKEFNEQFFKDKNIYLYKNYIYDNISRQLTVTKNNKPYADWNLLYQKEHYINLYTERNNRIIKYFRDRPRDLLIINFEEETDCKKILDFFDFPEELNFPLPHLNRSS